MRELRTAVAGEAPPTFIRCAKIKLTPRCNLRCLFCNYWTMNACPELGTARWREVIAELASLGCAKIHFSGGEPLLRSDVFELLECCTAHGMRANLTTNGTLINQRDVAERLLATGVRSVSISVDSPEPRLHDRIRGRRGALKATLRGIELLADVRARQRHRVSLRINTVLTRRNYTRLPEILRLAGELGCQDVHPMPVDERGPRRVRLSAGEIEEYNTYIAPQVQDLRTRYGFPEAQLLVWPFGTTEADRKLSKHGCYARRYYKRHLCYAPWLHTFIAWDGAVYLCCMARGKTPPTGNVAGQRVAEVFTGQAYETIRGQFRVARPKVCRYCDNFILENQQIEASLAPRSSSSAPAADAAPLV
ncbi:MAG TPA: radical SAM protein [Armatimonadota bacterium]|nr:radical SAM protein [Armatimonadota bacterium]HQK92798.1 radical SAM protein [Armatimonadota bacterium]